MNKRALLALPALLLFSCAPDNLGDLGVSSDGDAKTESGQESTEISSVQLYLHHAGYFPNPKLAHDFPRWRPIVDSAPKKGVLDDATKEALRGLQRRNGIEQTGTLDEDTRRVISSPRCGVPDGMEASDPASKFSYFAAARWTRPITWRIEPFPLGWSTVAGRFTEDQLRTSLNAAYSKWSVETDITVTEATAGQTADLVMRIGTAAPSTAVGGPGGITFDQNVTYSTGTPVTAMDLDSLVLHEAGHTLILDHSSVNTFGTNELPVMLSSLNGGVSRRTLQPDDVAAISSLYDAWNPRPGNGQDIAVGADGSVWAVGTWIGPLGDSPIYKWNAAIHDWEEASGSGLAVRIAVAPDGTAWVINSGGAIYTHSSNRTSGGWTLKNGANSCAKDIGAGADGSIWIVGCTTDPNAPPAGVPSGFVIRKFNSSTGAFDTAQGITHAVRISVAPNGVPWIVNSVNDVYARNSASPSVSANWTWMSNNQGAFKAHDIALSSDAFAYATGTDDKIYIRDDQTGNGVGTGTPDLHVWFTLPGSFGRSIAAGTVKNVWVMNINGTIYQQTSK